MEPDEEDDRIEGRESPAGYTLGESRTMKDVLEAHAELLESEGLRPAWKKETGDPPEDQGHRRRPRT